MLGLGVSDAAARAARSMIGYPTPTLDLSMMHGVLDSRVTFTRASSGTYTDSAGALRTQGYNLLTYSEQFDNAAWTKSNATVTAGAALGPDNTLSADKLVENTVSAGHYVEQTVTGTAANHVGSVYAKAGERSRITVYLVDTGGIVAGTSTLFDLSTGTVVTGPGTISSAGNGWYRCAVSGLPAAGSLRLRIILAVGVASSYVSDGISGAFLWGAQLELGSTLSDYSATTTAANSAPRFDYAITTPTVNYLTFSEQFDNAAWVKSQSSVTPDAAVSPTGTMTADKLIENSATGVQHFARQTVAVTAGTTYVQSVYVKAAERFRFRMELPTAQFSANERAIYDLSTQAITNTGGSPTIASVGNGWYRLTLTGACTTSGSANCIAMLMPDSGTGSTYDGNGTSGILVWGAQLEQSSTAGTYVPTSGIPERIGGSTTNLLLQSESFDQTWAKTRASVVPNAAIAPNGALTADKLVEDATASNSHLALQSVTGTPTIVHTFSVYAKAAERSYIHLQLDSGGTAGGQVRVSLTDGTTGTPAGTGSPTVAVSNAGNGWWRIALTAIPAASGTTVRGIVYVSEPATTTYTGDGVSGIYIWGAMLEAASSLGPYVATTTAAATVNTTEARGLLIEEARTNLFAGDLTVTGTWPAVATTRASGATAPDASTNGVTFTENASGTTSYGFNSASATITASTATTASIFAKAGTSTFLRLILGDATTATIAAQAWFNLTTGAVGTNGVFTSTGGTPTGISATIANVGGGWYRCTITATLATATTAFLLCRMTSADNVSSDTGSKTMSFFGPQIEVGAFATSYIPSTATASRAADRAQIATLTPWFNSAAGTLYAEFQRIGLDLTAFPRAASFSDGSTNNLIELVWSTGDQFAITTGGVAQGPVSVAGGGALGTLLTRIAAAYQLNDTAAVMNGGTVAVDGTATIPTVDRLNLGNRVDLTAARQFSGHIRRVKYFNSRLANATLQSITL